MNIENVNEAYLEGYNEGRHDCLIGLKNVYDNECCNDNEFIQRLKGLWQGVELK